MRIRCKFSTNPKLKLTIKRSEKHPKGYPARPRALGEKIRKHRMDLGLLQRDVAKFTGVATDTVTLWATGRTKPNSKNLRKIREFLNIKKFR